MLAKKHEFEYKITLAVCDKEHVGKTFEDGPITFTVSKHFYGGEVITKPELAALLLEADSVNLFGDKCVTIAEEAGFVDPKSVKRIAGIKHAQIYHL